MLSLQNREKSCSLRVKPGIPVPVDVVPVYPTRPVRLLPDPPAGTGRVYPRVRVDPHTSSSHDYILSSESTYCMDPESPGTLSTPPGAGIYYK